MFVSRTQAREYECPACGAKSGERCVGARGKQRESIHQERMWAASEATGAQPSTAVSLKGTQLVDINGKVLGQVVGLEIDLHDGGGAGGTYGGGGGGASSGRSTEKETEPQEGVQGELLPSPVNEVWSHYQQVIPNGERRKLDSRRRKCIQRALEVRTVDECQRAINALSRSAFHRGENDRKTSYLDIEYALGKRTDSPDAVIDRWLERSGGVTGELSPVETKLASLPEKNRRAVVDLMRGVRRGLFSSSQHQPVIDAGQRALDELRRCGFDVVTNPDGSFAGWKVIE